MILRIKLDASALLLGGLLAAGPAYALSPLPVDRASPIAFTVVDKQQVGEHLNADQIPTNPPPPAMAKPNGEPGQPANSGGDDEFKELEKEFPTTPWSKN